MSKIVHLELDIAYGSSQKHEEIIFKYISAVRLYRQKE